MNYEVDFFFGENVMQQFSFSSLKFILILLPVDLDNKSVATLKYYYTGDT